MHKCNDKIEAIARAERIIQFLLAYFYHTSTPKTEQSYHIYHPHPAIICVNFSYLTSSGYRKQFFLFLSAYKQCLASTRTTTKIGACDSSSVPYHHKFIFHTNIIIYTVIQFSFVSNIYVWIQRLFTFLLSPFIFSVFIRMISAAMAHINV